MNKAFSLYIFSLTMSAFVVWLYLSHPGILYFIPSVIQLRATTQQLTKTIPVAWEHGYKTPHVKAAPYENYTLNGIRVPVFIGFLFPLNPHQGDSYEILDFMKVNGGTPMRWGGYPGAEMFVHFEGVRDKESANKKLQEILPALEELMRK